MANIKSQTQISRGNSLLLSETEILVILRAADDIIAAGGRTLLAKILKGSRDKKVLQLGLNNSPVYGNFSALRTEEILARIDWMLHHDFLQIEYSGKLPLLVFTEKGWILERDQYADELLRQWDEWLANNVTPASMDYLKDRDRGLILLLLEKVRQTGNKRYLAFLQHWEKIEYKKVRQAIRYVMNCLESPADAQGPVALAPQADIKAQLKVEPNRPEVLTCWECGEKFTWEIKEQEFFKGKGFAPPKRCPACRENKWFRQMGIDPDEE